MTDFEDAINNLDLQLFEKIPSQSTDRDKQSLLACELAVRELTPEYNYLEIGSYLGGSIQPHLLDPKCRRIYSLDKRPHSQPDARGFEFVYENNSTARMMEKLAAVSENREKITTIDGDSKSIDPAEIKDKIQLCFIDGEHTDEAVFADFKFCLRVLDDRGAVVFHDAQITYNGIADCIAYLEKNDIKYTAYALPNIVFVIEVGDFPLHKNPAISVRLRDNHHSYLFALQNNDHYRRFATRFPFGMLRRLMLKVRGGNVSE
ncbi:MAG: class I SAM-dependent methyltransferase [Chloracidobacterium sp.]|nr:class I SAM-dependent methyltransferase [Chloracidobacterium sp.]